MKPLGSALAAALAVIALGVIFRHNDFVLGVLILAMVFGAVAQSWNLLAGYAGQWSLAQTAFFGIGAYVSGIALVRLHVPLLAGFVLAGVGAALAALAIGYVTLRIRGHYFALVTFLLITALLTLVNQFGDVTGGDFGLSIPLSRKTDVLNLGFDSLLSYYFISALLAAVATATVFAIERSRLGLLLMAIRDDEDAARMVGINAFHLKVLAMVISGAMAGIAGPVYLSVYKIIDPNTAFGVSAALNPVVAGILGGPGWVFGGLVGEFILQPVLAETNDLFGSTMFGAQQIVYGAILMLLILVMPRGIAGLVAGMRTRGRTGSRSAVPGDRERGDHAEGRGPARSGVIPPDVPAGKESRR
jgi:branched-chain amino acid transport system permease protein